MTGIKKILVMIAVAASVAGGAAAPAMADSHVAGGADRTDDSHVATAPEVSG